MNRRFAMMVSPSSLLGEDIINELGFDGYGKLTFLADHVARNEWFHLEDKHFWRYFRINARKAEKVLPTYRYFLWEVCESLKRIQKNSKVSESFAKLPPQNPYGSTRAINKTKLNETKRNEIKKNKIINISELVEYISPYNPPIDEPAF